MGEDFINQKDSERKIYSTHHIGGHPPLPVRTDIDTHFLINVMFMPPGVINAATAKENQGEWLELDSDIGKPWLVREYDFERKIYRDNDVIDVAEILSPRLRDEQFLNRYDTTQEVLDEASLVLRRWLATSQNKDFQLDLDSAIRAINERRKELKEDPNPTLNANNYLKTQLNYIWGTQTERFLSTQRSYIGDVSPERQSHFLNAEDPLVIMDTYGDYLNQLNRQIYEELPEALTMPKKELDELLRKIEFSYIGWDPNPTKENRWSRPFNLGKKSRIVQEKLNEVKQTINGWSNKK